MGHPESYKPGTILVLDDDAAMRTFIKLCLEKSGHHVLPAASLEEGEQLLATHGAALDLLISDIIVGADRGYELAELARLQTPDLPVLFISGHFDSFRGPLLSSEGVHFLGKPFTCSNLRAFIQQLGESALKAPHSR